MAVIGIVPEVLNEENYEFWKTCLKSYLVGHGLWDVIEREATTPYEEEKSPEWKMKNARALHAIQLACGSQTYSKLKKKKDLSAKFAWDHLAELRSTPSLHSEDHSLLYVQDDFEVQEHFQYEELYQAVEADDINQVNEILNKDPNAGNSIVTSHGDTALHIAILSGKMNIARALVEKMPHRGLETFNEFGATPLSLAALTGNIELARTIINKNYNLVSLRKDDHNGESSLPVIVASMYGKKRMVQYLYSVTPKDVLDPENGLDGVLLLNSLITSEFFDVAFMLLQTFPRLGVIPDHDDNYALHTLAHKPSAFSSGNKFAFWKHWIYNCVSVYSQWNADTQITKRSNGSDHVIDIHDEEESILIKRPSLLRHLGWILLQWFVPDIKLLHDKNLVNEEARKILICIFKEIRNMTRLQLDRMEIYEVACAAIQGGIVEFVEELLNYNPEFIWCKDKKGRTIFSYAIIFRQEKIFNLIYTLGAVKSAIVASRHDVFDNNFLHLAAKLSPPAQLERVSGAALQMQRELQWYKEVESLVQPRYKDQMNTSQKKPHAIFTEEHEELGKEGEKWMKNTAGSSMIVGTLIATVMFTTAFTIPGGNDQNSGLPIMLHTDSKAFMVFMISNGLSLIAASTSLLMYLGIHTAQYTEVDFHVSLPTKQIFGITCLFLSIVTMMVSFATAMHLMLHKTLSWVSIPFIVLSALPVVFFNALQLPLLIEMCRNTYCPSIFNRQKKHI